MEKDLEFDESSIVQIDQLDPFDMGFDAFDDEVVKTPKAEKKAVEDDSTTDTEIVEEEEDEEEEDIEPAPNPEDDEARLSVGIGFLKYLAERRGVSDQIDYTNIESAEDIQEVLDSFDDLDQAIAAERLKQSDKTIAQIVNYVERGGRPEEIISFLTQAKELSEIDITSETGSKTLLKDYYKNILGFSDDVVAKKIKKLEDNDLLNEEAEDTLPLYQEHLNKQMEQKAKKLEQEKKREKLITQQKQTAFVEQLKANKYSQHIATQFYQTAFSEVVLNNGDKVPLLDAKINQLKSSPEGLLKLASFVTDSKFYDEQVLANKGSEIVTKQTKQRLILNNKSVKSTPAKSGGGFQLKF
jgi:hypothetical protein